MKKLLTGKFCLSLVMLFFATLVSAQTVRGVVTDADTGDALIGANVSVQGFTVGTITDIDGSYSLAIPDGGEVLVFSYAGFTDQSVAIAGQTTIDVSLASGELLDEIVVVGYGTQKTKEVTSAVTSIKAKDFNAGNVTSAAGLLQGKVAGLTISRSGGDPNGSVGIRLRGLSTIGAQAEPLVVIDGVPGGSLSNIDPMDIESIDVLKDGSAAAIYGTRGSSGVILVTTKKGRPGTSRLTYNGYVSNESISRIPDVATAAEFRAANGNDAGATTDWYDEISQTGIAQSHNISLAGGTDQTSYRTSFNYRKQQGVVKNTGFEQINGSLALTQKALDDKLSVTINLIATNKDADVGFKEAFRYASIANPTSPITNEDGSYNQFSGFDVFNPVAMVDLNTNIEETNELLANVYAQYNITDALKITGSYAKQEKDRTIGEYYPSNSRYRGGVARNGFARKGVIDEHNDLFEGTLQYSGESGNISYTALAGTSFQKFNSEGLGIQAGGFLLDDNNFNQLSQAAEILSGQADVFSYGNSYSLQAQFGRVSVNIDDTYFGSASVRREGSDRFGPDNRYGIFPALSAGVDISKLSNISGVDNLKLRVGYGVTGNLPGQNNLFASIFNPGAQFFYNGEFVPSFGPTTNANPDLKWETKTEINVGVDFALSDYRLTGSLDVFNRKTDDLILFVAVPVPPNLAPNTWDNVASFSTNGIELAVNYNLIQGENFTYTPGLIFTSYSTILDEYLEDTPRQFRTNLGAPGQNITDAGVGLHLIEEGQALGQIVAPTIGNITEDGAIEFADLNNDGAIDAGDWSIVGNGLPDFEMSLNNNFTINKNWDLNIFIRGAFGHSLVNTYRAFYETFPDQPGANFINTSKANTAVKTASYNAEHVEDASFVRLDNMSLGYTFDTSNSQFGSARIFIAGQNLFTLTGYTGVDPEVRLGDTGAVDNGARDLDTQDVLAPGVDRRNTYFFTRTFTLGANISF